MKKTCKKCGETKEFAEFNKGKASKDGYQSKCRACEKQYKQDNKKKIADNKKHYYKNNKENFAKYSKERIFNAIPCVYMIRHITSGDYYIGSTTGPLGNRVSNHFTKETCQNSFFTGKDRNNWEWHELFTGSESEIRELEKYMLKLRVGIDNNCMNRRCW